MRSFDSADNSNVHSLVMEALFPSKEDRSVVNKYLIMKKSALIICCVCLSIAAVAKNAQPLISATIKGFGNDTVYVNCTPVTNAGLRTVDTILVKKDRFRFQKVLTDPTECTIFTNRCFVKRQNGRNYLPESRMMKVFLKPETPLTITGILTTDGLSYFAKGDGFNETYSRRRNDLLPMKSALDKRALQIDSMAFNNVDEKIIDKMDEDLNVQKIKAQQVDLDFIKANPSQDLSAYYLCNQPLDTFLVYVGDLDEKIRRGTFGKRLDLTEERGKSYKATQEAQKKVSEGTLAPDFALKSLDGSVVKLSDFKDKYLVIDFWGNWCYWCMKGVPQMKEYYEKYKDKVEFIGVDVRDKEEVWKATVEKNQMNWVHVMNLTDMDVPVLYGVSGYPTKLILDPEHRILARIIGESPDFYKKLDELFK